MANTANGKQMAATIDAWAKGQKEVEAAVEALEAARAKTAPHARTIYEALGSKPFSVKALAGRKYRAMHRPSKVSEKTGKASQEVYAVIPVPEFEAQNEY